MKKALAATALAATLLAGSAATSFAATTAVTLDADGNANINGSASANTSFTDYFTFAIGQNVISAGASVTATFARMKVAVTNFTISLFKGEVGSGSPVPGTSTTTTVGGGKAPTNVYATFGSDDSYAFAAGNYYLAVSGKTGSNTATYGGSLSISSVPLPSTVALFGVALAGLGVAGAMRRKSAASAA